MCRAGLVSPEQPVLSQIRSTWAEFMSFLLTNLLAFWPMDSLNFFRVYFALRGSDTCSSACAVARTCVLDDRLNNNGCMNTMHFREGRRIICWSALSLIGSQTLKRKIAKTLTPTSYQTPLTKLKGYEKS